MIEWEAIEGHHYEVELAGGVTLRAEVRKSLKRFERPEMWEWMAEVTFPVDDGTMCVPSAGVARYEFEALDRASASTLELLAELEYGSGGPSPPNG